MDSMIATPEHEVAQSSVIGLVLVWRGRQMRLISDAETRFSLGSHRANNLVVSGTYVSREHATLVWQRNGFELIDHSTNGSFVQLEDEQITHIHRGSVRLWGAGFLSFGEPLTDESAVRFSHA